MAESCTKWLDWLYIVVHISYTTTCTTNDHMSKSKLPNVLHDPDFPNEAHLNLEDGNTITVGTNAWFGWLEEHSSFHFDSGKDFFTALKRKYDTGDYWYASRKAGGKTQNKYLGKSDMLTLERMRVIASKLSQPLQPKEHVDVQPNVQLQDKSVVQLYVQPKQVQELEEKLASCNRNLQEQYEQNQALRSNLTKITSDADQLAVNLKQERSRLATLQEDLKEAEKLAEARLQEIERLRTQLQPPPAVDPNLIALLQDAITPKKKGGSYDARNATGLRRLVEQVLGVLLNR